MRAADRLESFNMSFRDEEFELFANQPDDSVAFDLRGITVMFKDGIYLRLTDLAIEEKELVFINMDAVFIPLLKFRDLA